MAMSYGHGLVASLFIAILSILSIKSAWEALGVMAEFKPIATVLMAVLLARRAEEIGRKGLSRHR
jgi:hypothetical protein